MKSNPKQSGLVKLDTRDIEMDRMMMAREDQLSLHYEKFCH